MADADQAPPVAEDLRLDDENYNPQVEPAKAKAWLNMLLESEKAFQSWNDHCDKIDKQFANLERLAASNRDKQFQMFWANCEVLKPSIYAKPPVPVVATKFKDRRPVPQASAEMMERCAVVAFDMARINDTMMLIRDDCSMLSRGVAWCRYESGSGDGYYGSSERVCIDFKHRRDFLHSISRCWYEVTWVAAASYLTRKEARTRFKKTSGDEYQRADYKVDKDSKNVGGADNRERAKFWEIWHKPTRRVVWVAEGCELVLDEDDPHLDLEGFFPCPRPAYGTVQRGSLVPVPDVLQYKDQLDEIDLLTSRIHALSDALEAKGFYPAGGAELSDAIQAAVKAKTPGRLLVPISNWAAFGGSKEVIIWLPIDMIANTITALVALRKQVIDDIYQIMGLSDIMRGATDPQETLGAQELKTQYGSTRIRDKQQELVRIARDLVVITTEIITEKFDDVTIIEMSQTMLPTQQMIQQQVQAIQQQMAQGQQQLVQAAQSPQGQQIAQANPQQAQQLLQQFQQQMQVAQQNMQKLQQKPTVEQVLRFIKNSRIKAFTLDIETDSTIQADENAEKQRRTEFVQVLGTLLPQISQMIAAEPKTTTFCGELLKFATAPFRAGRTLDGAIDDLVATMNDKADQPRPDDPATTNAKTALQIEQMKDQRQRDKDKQDAQLAQQEMVQKDEHKRMELANQQQIERMRLSAKGNDAAGKAQLANQKAIESQQEHQATMLEKSQDMEIERAKADNAAQDAQAKRALMSQQAQHRQAAEQFKLMNPPQRPGGI